MGIADVAATADVAAMTDPTVTSAFVSSFAVADVAVMAEPASAGTSVMEGVAQARLSSVTGAGGALLWQPGLLTVNLQGRVTDALGLGDIVAPSILAGWAHRFDLSLAGVGREGGDAGGDKTGDDKTGDENGEKARAGGGAGGGYLSAALAGYGVGCVLLEVAPPELTRAALLFLVPSMLTAVLGRLALQGDLGRALATGSEPAGTRSE